MIRILLGLVILVLAFLKHSQFSKQLAAGEPVLLYGKTLNLSSGQFTMAFAVIGLIGLALVGLGIATLLKAKR